MGELFNFSDTSWLTSSDGRHKLLFDLTNNRLDLQDVGDIRCLTGTALAERLRITAAGNVGIGTASPQQSLSINGALNVDQANANTGTVNPGVTFGSTSGEGLASKRTAGGNQFGLDFYTGAVARLSITNAGNVGIGTTQPNYKLQVQGNALFTGDYLYVNSEGAGRLRVGAAWSMPGLYAGDDGAKDLSLGVPPGRRVYLGVATQDAYVEGGSGNAYFKGTVGLGTPTPDTNYKLDVAGNVKLPNGGIAYSPGRLHIHGEEILYLLNKGGVIVSRAWGGNGNLTVDGELFLGGGGRTSIRDFDGGGVGSGYHWIRTNANEGDLWMAFAYPFPGTTIPKRIEGAVPFYGRFLNSSDARNKTNIEQLGGMLAKLEHIRGVAFDWDAAQPGLGAVPGQRSMGVIAQEVESIFPELVSSYGPQGYKAVDYTGLTGILLEAVKELKAATEVLGARMEGLERAVQS